MYIDIKNLTKKYDEQTVLDLSITIDNINSLVIIGPSGGGKSTLIRILSGLETPTSGRIQINSTKLEINDKFLYSWRKKTGFVFQSFNLFPHLTAYKNIVLPLEKVHKYSKRKAAERADYLLEKFHLTEHSQKFPGHLSGGQKQRIAIARALAPQPEILFLDEPTSALDPELSREVLEMIKRLKGEKIDIVLVTHEYNYARQIADYVIHLDRELIKGGKDYFSEYPPERTVYA